MKTLNIDEDLHYRLKDLAHKSGKKLGDFIDETIREGLKVMKEKKNGKKEAVSK